MRLAKCLALVAACLVGSAFAGPPAGASGVRPTVSALSASPAVIASGGGLVWLEATVTNGVSCSFTSNRPVTGLISTPCPAGLLYDGVTIPANTTSQSLTYKFALRVVGAKSRRTAHVHVTVQPSDGSAPPPSGLDWISPPSITLGMAYDVSSVDRCPATMPDGSPVIGTVEAEVTIRYPGGGGASVTPLDSNGSWSSILELNGDWPAGAYVAEASCIVYPSQVVIATYTTHALEVS